MSTKKQNTTALTTTISTPTKTFIGIDYHKRYSVYLVVDEEGKDVAKGRIDHMTPDEFAKLVRRFPGCRVAFEATMNWHWLFELLETQLPADDIVMANPFKTRIIAEAQVKTDKVDARILALLLRADMIWRVHIPCKATRERKEVLRQRCFFVRQRTMLRNRIHRLLALNTGWSCRFAATSLAKRAWAFWKSSRCPRLRGSCCGSSSICCAACKCASKKTRRRWRR